MSAPATIAYAHIDNFDRHFYDHLLANDTERYAFILFFQHVNAKYQRSKRPRSGHGRVHLWNKCRGHWIRKARSQQPIPAIHRSAPFAPGAPVAPVAPVVPAAPVAGALPNIPQPPPAINLTTHVPTASIDIAPIAAPIYISTLNVPLPSGIIEVIPSAGTINSSPRSPLNASSSPTASSKSGTKRTRESNEDRDIASLEPPAKRHKPAIGGERCPPFVLHNERKSYLPPTLQQREFIEKTLGGGIWRYAKTIHQPLIDRWPPKPRSGIPRVSTYLFVKIDDQNVIQDRVVVKCTDLSWDKDVNAKLSVKCEEDVVRAIPDGCPHLPFYRNLQDHTMNFTIDGAYLDNKVPSSWRQRYVFSDYAPHGNLMDLMANHASAKKPIPEHFIWYVFKHVVDALVTFATGQCSDMHVGPITAQKAKSKWRRILHLDIHPSNVVLAKQDPKYATYRQPVLIGFDLSTLLSDDPATRKQQLQQKRIPDDAGWTWLAPEQYRVPGKPSQIENWGVEHTTDLFSLAQVIRALMLCGTRPAEEIGKFQKDEMDSFRAEAISPDNVRSYEVPWGVYPDIYSTALIQTVHRCLALRPVQDRERPYKPFRPSLYELRDRIDRHLSRLDTMYGGAAIAEQYGSEHPLHVVFPEEDPQYAIGVVFSPQPPALTVQELSLASADDREKAMAHDSYTKYASKFQQVGNEEGFGRSGDSQPNPLAQESALQSVITEVRQEVLRSAHSAERDQRVQATDHAGSTILKCVNPHGTFKQLRGKQKPAFFSPEAKAATLTSIKHWAGKLADEDNDPAQMKSLQYLQQAADIVLAVLVLGEESGLAPESADEHWMTTVSDLHRGVWEYFWSRPDAVILSR
ncbi:hypothetical protein N0V83_001918 [Neocucurbitaria cava]|uniref:Protein kinase domain-containing protein n=1 Tax=Neocucurbitaria cava TaxID=798079 RepID=A0A9W9CPJ8_9PLEO|nr:hypothetical protein N0V83_001918 [Neocucurbitaria cava]